MEAVHATQEALREARDFRKQLSLRTAGLNDLVWAVCTAGTMLVYAAATLPPPLEWLYGLLWVPFITTGLVLSQGLWKGHALSLGLRPTRAGVFWACAAGAVVFAATVGFTDRWAGAGAAQSAVGFGNVAAIVVLALMLRHWQGMLVVHLLGGLVAAVGVVGALAVGGASTDLMMAGAVFLGWALPGAVLLARS